jgi:hypothetical protein
VAYFDDVRFASVDPAVSDDVENSTPAALRATDDGGAGDVGSEAPGARVGPTTLANERQEPQAQAMAGGGGRPLWPLLLALGVPASALATVAGHAWWKARLAERNRGHI